MGRVKINSGFVGIVACLAMVFSGLLWLLRPSEAKTRAQDGKVLRSKIIRDAKKASAKNRTVTRIEGFSMDDRKASPAGLGDSAGKKPWEFVDDDMESLSEDLRKLLAELAEASDENDRTTVFKKIQALQAMIAKGVDVPAFVKLRAISALSWIGSSGVPELLGFLGDADVSVVDAAYDSFGEMLGDFSMGDRQTAEILKQVVKVVKDEERLRTYLMELDNMRPSVKYETASAIFGGDNKVAVSVLQEQSEFIFGGENTESVTSQAELDKWRRTDGVDGDPVEEEEEYGPVKSLDF